MRYSARLVEASSSRFPNLPPNSPPALEFTVIFPFPPPTVEVEPSITNFEISWKKWREQIEEYDGEFLDSQEKDFHIHKKYIPI
jgi:hypothetical protein